MKKIFALLLILATTLSLFSCGSSTTADDSETAFEVSKTAYENINEAYEEINKFSQDIYTAWNMGTTSSDKADIDGTYTSSGYYTSYTYYDDEDALTAFADELHISKENLESAVAALLGKSSYDPGSEDDPGDWYMLSHYNYSSFFSACVDVVTKAYEKNGTSGEIKELLEEARGQMKQLSDNYSDYEYYPNLKEYFTNTTAFFGFCIDPEGSFNQVVDTFNDYRNNARNYYYDLNYVFEDSIFDN